MIHCDVVIVGAGPGGSAAAYWLARSGADVVLLDKAHFPRSKPCGDGLTPRAVRLLEDIGLGDFVHRRGHAFTQVCVSHHGEPQASHTLRASDAPGVGLVLPRRELDDALCRHAARAGARFLPGYAATEPRLHAGCVRGLIAEGPAGKLEVESKLIIIATGASRALSQTLGLMGGDRPKALAMRGYVEGIADLDGSLEVYVDRELLPGYAWVFPTSMRSANIGVGITVNGTGTQDAGRQMRRAFERLLHSSRLEGARLTGKPQGYPLRTDFPSVPCCADGVLVVGEAAGLVDPLTGEGIALALESGQLAAEVSLNALAAHDCSKERLQTYEHTLHERHAAHFRGAQELMDRLSDPQVMDACIHYARKDSRVRRAFQLAVVDERPHESISLLADVLGSNRESLSAQSLFVLNAYRPLLDECRKYIVTHVSQDAPSPIVIDLVSRGKMLRALLVFLGCQAAHGDPSHVLAGAAGMELVHAASLVHDDVMDDARSRRGLPALHTTLGTARAIVCGDYLIAKAFRLLAESRVINPASRVVDAFIIGAESGVRVCAGQFHDVSTWTAETLNETAYDRVIADKTAAAISGALKAGAALAGGDDALLRLLASYGECVGRAFQVRDDILEFTQLGADGAIDRKPSLPLIHAFASGGAKARDIIRDFLAGRPMDIRQLARLLNEAGSIAYAQAVAEAKAEEAIQHAQTIPNVAAVLEAFAHYAAMRNQ
jgi:geranylgeranyl reductase family protein